MKLQCKERQIKSNTSSHNLIIDTKVKLASFSYFMTIYLSIYKSGLSDMRSFILIGSLDTWEPVACE